MFFYKTNNNDFFNKNKPLLILYLNIEAEDVRKIFDLF